MNSQMEPDNHIVVIKLQLICWRLMPKTSVILKCSNARLTEKADVSRQWRIWRGKKIQQSLFVHLLTVRWLRVGLTKLPPVWNKEILTSLSSCDLTASAWPAVLGMKPTKLGCSQKSLMKRKVLEQKGEDGEKRDKKTRFQERLHNFF